MDQFWNQRDVRVQARFVFVNSIDCSGWYQSDAWLCKRKKKEWTREQYFCCTCQLIDCSWELLCSSQTWRTIRKIKTRLFSFEDALRSIFKMICVVTPLQYSELLRLFVFYLAHPQEKEKYNFPQYIIIFLRIQYFLNFFIRTIWKINFSFEKNSKKRSVKMEDKVVR